MPATGATARRRAALDVITIGRSSVDLYGKQIGSRLEDSPPSPNRSAAARPTSPSAPPGSACSSASITGVGDEQMGRFIREQLRARGRRAPPASRSTRSG